MMQAKVQILILAALAGFAQTPADGPSFGAASITRNRSMSSSRNGIQTSPGRLRVDNTPFLELVEECYGPKGYQLRGAPEWLRSEPYDVAAVAKDGASRGEMIEMLKPMMADRLQLRFHREDGDTDGFSLEVAKNGPKFQEYQPQPGDTPDNTGGL